MVRSATTTSSGLRHRSLAPTEEVSVTTCLSCHGAGTRARHGMGAAAPLSLRHIVHPAHMSSQWFKLHHGGNCFTCRNVNDEGEREPLTEAVTVNEKVFRIPTTCRFRVRSRWGLSRATRLPLPVFPR